MGSEMCIRDRIGWHLAGDAPDRPSYSAQLAITLTVTSGVFFGIALAGVGLGLQAQNRRTPWIAIGVTAFATSFWIVQKVFFIGVMGSVVLSSVCMLLVLIFAALTVLAITAATDMVRNPPPAGFENLPADYRIPYSHMHQDLSLIHI